MTRILAISFFLAALLAVPGQAADEDDEGMIAGSKGTRPDMRAVVRAAWGWISKNVEQEHIFITEAYRNSLVNNKEKIGAEINKVLKEKGLPEMELSSPDFKLYVVEQNGFGGNSFAGLHFVDGKNKFCFPCSAGWNSYEWGLVPFERSKRNPAGKFHGALTCLEGLAPYVRTTENRLNDSNFPGTRILPIAATESGRKGFFVVTDETAYFYPAPYPDTSNPGERYKIYKITLPNGKTTGVRLYHDDRYDLVYASEEETPAGDAPDLGKGVGDKVNPKLLAELQKVFASHAESASSWIRRQPAGERARFSRKACTLFEECSKHDTLNSRKVRDAIEDEQEELKCSGQSSQPEVKAPGGPTSSGSAQ